MERQNISTSIEAYHSLKADSIRAIYQKIIDALKVLGMASTEQIAEYIGMEHAKIHKRVSEMERLEIIWRPGKKVPTKSGRSAYQWTLRNNQPLTDEQEKNQYKNGQTTAHDHAKKIIEQSSHHFEQPSLF